MLNTLNLGESILSIGATNEIAPDEPVSFISSFEVPAFKKIPFRGILLCLFYKTKGGFLKFVLLEARRGPNTLSAYETFNDQRLEARIGDLLDQNPLFDEFVALIGYDSKDDLLRTIWSAAFYNIPTNDLSEPLSHCRLK